MSTLARQNRERTRVLIVDDHTVVRIGLTEFINRDGRFEVVGEADSCHKGLELVYRQLPDIVILDTELGDASGCSALIQLHSLFPDIAVLIYTSNHNHKFVDEAFSHNVSAFVLKSSPLETLMHAIQTIDGGMQFIDPQLPAYVPAGSKPKTGKETKTLLTHREQTILRMMATGKSNKEIANELFITERTVKFHVSAILRRLRVKNRTQAVRVATDLHLIDSPAVSLAHSTPTPINTHSQDRHGLNVVQHHDRRSGKPQANCIYNHPDFDRRSGRDRRKVARPMPLHLHLAMAE